MLFHLGGALGHNVATILATRLLAGIFGSSRESYLDLCGKKDFMYKGGQPETMSLHIELADANIGPELKALRIRFDLQCR